MPRRDLKAQDLIHLILKEKIWVWGNEPHVEVRGRRPRAVQAAACAFPTNR